MSGPVLKLESSALQLLLKEKEELSTDDIEEWRRKESSS